MLTPSIARWLGLAFLLLCLALAMGNVVVLVASIFVLLVALTGLLLPLPGGVVIVRRIGRSVYWTGDVVHVRREVEIGGGIGPLFIHDEIPSELQLAQGNNFRMIWKWPGPKTHDLSYALVCPKRGKFWLEAPAWEAQDALALRPPVGASMETGLSISVVPRLREMGRLNQGRSIASRRQPGSDVSRIGVSTTDFVDVRRYAAGDSMRSVNWKASARRVGRDDALMVNRYEPEGRKAIWIFLDCADYMDVGTTLTSPIEHAVEAVGTVAHYYLSQGYTLGAYAYNGPRSFLSPDSGRKQFDRLTQQLLTLKTGPPMEDLLKAVEWCKVFLIRLRPEIFIFTRLDVHYPGAGASGHSMDRFAAGLGRLASLRSRSRASRPGQLSVVHIAAQEYLASASSLEKQTLALTRWETRPLTDVVRRRGASVVEWNPVKEDFPAVLMRHIQASR